MRTRTSDTYYINNDHTNVIKVWEYYTEFDTEEINTKSKERQQLVC